MTALLLSQRKKGIQHLSCQSVKLKISHLQHLDLSATAALAKRKNHKKKQQSLSISWVQNQFMITFTLVLQLFFFLQTILAKQQEEEKLFSSCTLNFPSAKARMQHFYAFAALAALLLSIPNRYTYQRRSSTYNGEQRGARKLALEHFLLLSRPEQSFSTRLQTSLT